MSQEIKETKIETATTEPLIQIAFRLTRDYHPLAILDALSVAFNRLDDPNAEMLHRTMRNAMAAYVTRPRESK